MKRRPSSRVPRAPVVLLWRHGPGGDERLFSEIRERCHRGDEIHVRRQGLASYSVVANGTMWLARPIGGSPIGSFYCVAAAVIAGDRYVEAWSDGDDSDGEPRGAA